MPRGMDKNPSPGATILTLGREPHPGEMMRLKLAAAQAKRGPKMPYWHAVRTQLFHINRQERRRFAQPLLGRLRRWICHRDLAMCSVLLLGRRIAIDFEILHLYWPRQWWKVLGNCWISLQSISQERSGRPLEYGNPRRGPGQRALLSSCPLPTMCRSCQILATRAAAMLETTE